MHEERPTRRGQNGNKANGSRWRKRYSFTCCYIFSNNEHVCRANAELSDVISSFTFNDVLHRLAKIIMERDVIMR